MINTDVLREELLKVYRAGATQQEISQKSGVAQSYIADLMSGKKKFDGLTLRKVNQLFPHATLNLRGGAVVADNSGVNNGVLGVNNSTINVGAEFVIDKIINSDDLTADEKIKVLKVIKK